MSWPPLPVDRDQLEQLTGVLAQRVNVSNVPRGVNVKNRYYRSAHGDEARIDAEALRKHEHLLEEIFTPRVADADVVHVVLDGEIYYDFCVGSRRRFVRRPRLFSV